MLESFFTGFLALTLLEEIQSLSVTISPDTDAFILQRPNRQIIDGNISRSSIYIHNGCIYNTEQLLTAQIGEQRFSLPLYSSMQNLYCAVAVKVVQSKISIEKPFVDIVVYRDHSWTNTFRKELCISIKFQNINGST
uniref:Uncharacterized protein n=1 Tax=Panagrolaimus sp. PS1159 TaxID=55785 RepID=A0AC35FAS7_9BILA